MRRFPRSQKQFAIFAPLLVAALMIPGCGGGGSAASAIGGAANAQIGVYAADDLGAYDHVWVTVKSIELIGPSGAKTVFADAAGKQLDLAALHEGSLAKFAFLGLGTAPEGTYSSARVTFAEDLVLFPTGATTGLARKFAGALGGEKALTIQANGGGEDIGGNDSLIIDFDLSRWNDDGAFVSAVAEVRGHEGLDDPARHHGEDYRGDASNVTASGFTLRGEHDEAISVTTDASTEFYGDATSVTAGQRVQVRGTFDPATRTLAAVSVKIDNPGQGDGEHRRFQARGIVGASSATGFDLALDDCEGFLPETKTLHILYGEEAHFRGPRGVELTRAQFAAALAASSVARVSVEGDYDSARSTLTAFRLKKETEIEHDGNHEGHGGGGGGGSTGGHEGGNEGGHGDGKGGSDGGGHEGG